MIRKKSHWFHLTWVHFNSWFLHCFFFSYKPHVQHGAMFMWSFIWFNVYLIKIDILYAYMEFDILFGISRTVDWDKRLAAFDTWIMQQCWTPQISFVIAFLPFSWCICNRRSWTRHRLNRETEKSRMWKCRIKWLAVVCSRLLTRVNERP